MTEENLVHNQDPLSDAAAAENLSVFFDEIGVSSSDIQNTSEYNRRVIAQVPLTIQLEALPVGSQPYTERDNLALYFNKQNWLPKQLQEANIAAVKGLDETLRRARNTSQGDQTEAQLNTLETVKRYFTDSLRDVKTLNLVRTIREGTTMLPNIDSLRVTRPVLYTMADMFLAREFLDNAEWANSNWSHYIERQRYWRGFMLFAAEYARDEVLTEAFDHLYAKAQNRRRHWSVEFREIDRKIGGLATNRSQLTEKPAETKIEPEDGEPPHKEGLTDFEELIPEGAKKELERAIQEYADRSAQIDRYVDDQGMTLAEAEHRVLQGRALRYRGHIVGIEGKDEKISRPHRSSRGPKTRRGLHGQGLMNADEPPPGVPDARRDRTG